MDPLTGISTRRTPQTVATPGRETEQVANAAGGYVFPVDDVTRLRRFLTLGTDGGTYYATAPELTKANAAVVFRMAEEDPQTLRNVIYEISTAGRAPKANPALFALAVAASVGTAYDRGMALGLLPAIARTGTHLFIFARYVEQFRGWGRSLRRAVGDWYLEPDADRLAYQTVKYRQREGWSHRDLLRLASPPRWHAADAVNRQRAADPARRAVFDWIVRGAVGDHTPALITGFLAAQAAAKNHGEVARLVREHRLSWEMLPDEALGSTVVWDALLDVGMGQTALMRQLPRLTRLGMLPQMGGRTSEVVARLTDTERLQKGRVHPMNVLVAARTYGAGQSARGAGTWTPTGKVVDALSDAFYASFRAVEPTGKRTLLALDVSGSMTAPISGMPLTAREASAAMALVTATVEPDHQIVGFTSGRRGGWGSYADTALTPLAISPRQRLADSIRAVSGLPFGGTDCALPFTWALRNRVEVDQVVIFTDNESWAGPIHVHQAVRDYREKMGIGVKLVACAMTATDYSVADPNDAGQMNVAGFDSAVPNLIADFARA